ncbi:MAG: TRAP transporter large permease subunit [Planctomycetota bacterium]|jgi:tripartite ATP-independent transporter DctM subunit|nr:TRAP transporter large permease subunit [Planctomycetota bacterium]
MATTLVLFLFALVLFIVMGIPIAFSLLACAVALMFHMGEFDPQIVAQRLVAGGANFSLMAIPFFILAGEVMNAGGLSQRIVDLPLKLFGHVRGGLGYVAIVATVIMASLSGSAVADTAAIGAILIPMMRQAGYPILTSAGLVAAGGIIAPIIPPSMPFIIFGVTGNVSIFRLFMGGIVPGLIMGAGLMITWYFHNKRLDMRLQARASWPEVWKSTVSSLWALALPVIIIGGFRIGVFTATEAGAVAASYAILVGFLVYRELKPGAFYEVLVNTVKTVGVVMFLVATANVSAYLMALAELPNAVAELFGPLIESPRLLMLTIMLFTLFVGMVMDLSPAILILVPVLMPLVRRAGIDETYFGILFTLNLCIGLITPPVGNVLNVITGIARIKFDEAARGVFPYLCAHIVVLAILVAWPNLTIVPMRFMVGR